MNELLRTLVDTRDRQIQKARIQFGNRINAIERGADESSGQQAEILERYYAQFRLIEDQLDKDIAEMVAEEPVYDYVSAVKGIGPGLAAKLIAMIDIERAPTVSALWRFAGYAVIDGERERMVKGEKAHYNKRLKTTCYLAGSSFLKSGSPYREVYDDARAYYLERRPDWTKGHQHNAAMRKMIKMFLQHLWVTWRTICGLPTNGPYAHDIMGHAKLRTPHEFGWPEIAIAHEKTTR